ncbi:hypothetical protein BDN72DRAFT_954258 [Pluteus cervinus]|uniref:Uncharacterized protein n=1 Tax=Pluteus cervinus TaxID=181527 RepID=A0ACD3BF85_9AGAR|nr:hypothetical protein BDN72DRAFT_954258 [Pluteus cervinus]
MRPTTPLLFLPALTAARFLHSLPDDPHAFPKYRVSFLNRLPVANQTAERWLAEGLAGGEQQFLERPWNPSFKGIEGADPFRDPASSSEASSSVQPAYTLERMKLGPNDSFLCLIPKPLDIPHLPLDEEPEAEITPARSWSLLQPLTGSCLYHRQGWFTYSYCHNDEIRQFKELIQAHPHAGGSYKPEEDPEWESYTLGKAPAAPEPGADLTLAEQHAQAANLELARTAGSRYLVQRWGDGSVCDKTGKHREVEVQFHCSMAMTDNILFVKEAKTCSYVLVVHTPRLCGEPGFKSRRDAEEEALIRCREVVSTLDPSQPTDLSESDHPLKVEPPRRKPILPHPAQAPPKGKDANSNSALGGSEANSKSQDQIYKELVRKALQAMMSDDNLETEQGEMAFEQYIDDGELVVELDDLDGQGTGTADKLVNALRAAGFDVKAEKITTRSESKKDAEKDEKRKQQQPRRSVHDEL